MSSIVYFSLWLAAALIAVALVSATFFQGEGEDGETPLEEARHIKQGWFPELAGDMGEILIVHNRLVDFLWNRQLPRVKDPERWMESDPDSRFLELWRQHRHALDGVQLKLRSLAHVAIRNATSTSSPDLARPYARPLASRSGSAELSSALPGSRPLKRPAARSSSNAATQLLPTASS